MSNPSRGRAARIRELLADGASPTLWVHYEIDRSAYPSRLRLDFWQPCALLSCINYAASDIHGLSLLRELLPYCAGEEEVLARALCLAAERAFPACVGALLSSGAPRGEDAVVLAVHPATLVPRTTLSRRRVSVLSMLISAGCPWDAGDVRRRPLARALYMMKWHCGRERAVATDLARTLLRAGVDLEAASAAGHTLLHEHALEIGGGDALEAVPVFRLLLEHGACANARSASGATPLMCCVSVRCAAHGAARSLDAKITAAAEVLLHFGADPSGAVEVARAAGHVRAAALLEGHTRWAGARCAWVTAHATPRR